ncbi:hypothetical protein GIB67_023079, partial [Kingdonia uniflora]
YKGIVRLKGRAHRCDSKGSVPLRHDGRYPCQLFKWTPSFMERHSKLSGEKAMQRYNAFRGHDTRNTPIYISEVRKVTALAVAEGEVPLPLLQQQSVEKKVKPCQLYVCNLPDNYDVPELQDLFKPFGTVSSLEVSKNAETGLSRGCGYVTMSSFKEAQAAIFALDGSDVGGRELRIRKSAGMKDKLEASNSTPTRNIMFETPHKLYIGNLAWSVKPEDLREHFSQFGTVVSTRVLFDRKTGRNRVYAFLSFSSVEEREAALSSNGTEFSGRTLLVREAIKSSEPSVSTV